MVLSTPTRTNHPHIAAPSSQGMPLSTSGERQSRNALCQLLKSQTCSKHNNTATNRNRQITVETRAQVRRAPNTNKHLDAWSASSELCVPCLWMFHSTIKKNPFDLLKSSHPQSEMDGEMLPGSSPCSPLYTPRHTEA